MGSINILENRVNVRKSVCLPQFVVEYIRQTFNEIVNQDKSRSFTGFWTKTRDYKFGKIWVQKSGVSREEHGIYSAYYTEYSVAEPHEYRVFW